VNGPLPSSLPRHPAPDARDAAPQIGVSGLTAPTEALTLTAAMEGASAARPAHTAQDWRDLTARIGADIAHPLTSALERVNALIATGRIERDSLRALRDELDQARCVGMACQQVARLATRRLKQSHERIALHELLQHVLAHRALESQARGQEVRSSFEPADVLADPPLLFGFAHAVVDWAVSHAQGPLELQLELPAWPVQARWRVCFTPPHHGTEAGSMTLWDPLRDVTWQLVVHTAQAIGLPLSLRRAPQKVELIVTFPRTVDPRTGQGPVPDQSVEVSEELSSNSQLLAGSHVLVVCARREVRLQIREAVRDMSMVVDFVGSLDEAMSFCADTLPHAMVVESVLVGPRCLEFRRRLRKASPDFPVIEIAEAGPDFEVSGVNGRDTASVNRQAIGHALAPALIFEMTRSL